MKLLVCKTPADYEFALQAIAKISHPHMQRKNGMDFETYLKQLRYETEDYTAAVVVDDGQIVGGLVVTDAFDCLHCEGKACEVPQLFNANNNSVVVGKLMDWAHTFAQNAGASYLITHNWVSAHTMSTRYWKVCNGHKQSG